MTKLNLFNICIEYQYYLVPARATNQPYSFFPKVNENHSKKSHLYKGLSCPIILTVTKINVNLGK